LVDQQSIGDSSVFANAVAGAIFTFTGCPLGCGAKSISRQRAFASASRAQPIGGIFKLHT